MKEENKTEKNSILGWTIKTFVWLLTIHQHLSSINLKLFHHFKFNTELTKFQLNALANESFRMQCILFKTSEKWKKGEKKTLKVNYNWEAYI